MVRGLPLLVVLVLVSGLSITLPALLRTSAAHKQFVLSSSSTGGISVLLRPDRGRVEEGALVAITEARSPGCVVRLVLLRWLW